jgi:mannose-6-phosphate isomerase-like protein (cupin superfamily)
MTGVENILGTYLHVRDDGCTQAVAVDASFWSDVAEGRHPQLDEGRLMSAFTFSAPWPTWERHPAGEELVILLSGSATVVLELDDGERSVELRRPGDFVLVPPGTWHTAKTAVTTTMLFLTPGAGTEHRPADA